MRRRRRDDGDDDAARTPAPHAPPRPDAGHARRAGPRPLSGQPRGTRTSGPAPSCLAPPTASSNYRVPTPACRSPAPSSRLAPPTTASPAFPERRPPLPGLPWLRPSRLTTPTTAEKAALLSSNVGPRPAWPGPAHCLTPRLPWPRPILPGPAPLFGQPGFIQLQGPAPSCLAPPTPASPFDPTREPRPVQPWLRPSCWPGCTAPPPVPPPASVESAPTTRPRPLSLPSPRVPGAPPSTPGP